MTPDNVPLQKSSSHRLSHRMRGVAMLEVALILPLFLTVLAIIIDGGIMLYDKAIITNASREATRAGIVQPGIVTARLTPLEIQAVATSRCSTMLVTFGVGNVKTCSAVASNPDPLTVRVEVTYQYTGLVWGTLFQSRWSKLSATTSMSYE